MGFLYYPTMPMTMQCAFIVKNSFLEEVDDSEDAPKPMVRSYSDSALYLLADLDSESDDEDDCMDKRSEATASTADSAKRWPDEDDFDDVFSAGGSSPRIRSMSPGTRSRCDTSLSSSSGPPPGVHFVNQPPPGVHQGPPGINQAPPGVHCVPVEPVFWVPAATEAETPAKPQFPAGPPGCWDGKTKKAEESSE